MRKIVIIFLTMIFQFSFLSNQFANAADDGVASLLHWGKPFSWQLSSGIQLKRTTYTSIQGTSQTDFRELDFFLDNSAWLTINSEYSFGVEWDFYFINSTKKKEQRLNGVAVSSGSAFNNNSFNDNGIADPYFLITHRQTLAPYIFHLTWGFSPGFGDKDTGEATIVSNGKREIGGNAKRGGHAMKILGHVGENRSSIQWRAGTEFEFLFSSTENKLTVSSGDTAYDVSSRWQLTLDGELQSKVTDRHYIGGLVFLTKADGAEKEAPGSNSIDEDGWIEFGLTPFFKFDMTANSALKMSAGYAKRTNYETQTVSNGGASTPTRNESNNILSFNTQFLAEF